ncbi:helix-turn-helix domain-containing protein [Roseisolibacter agri]|uniref:helix-turn-helix domain-containing protein n=1 Tax=Roseisolibacter agri TaxID=2014610 RepID=UPI0024E0B673|nr:helix-turn-helix domain-containing protein [Roseisolibacter agri]
MAAIADSVPAIGRPLMELYLRGADGAMPVTEAARQLGVHRKTLRNRMEAAGLPAPADLRAWCRLFMAGRLLEEAGRTVESVAHQLEFSTGSALRNLIKRRTGLAPYMLREAGGLPYLIACFNADCDRRRLAHGNGHAPTPERPVPLALVPTARVAESAPKGRSRSSRTAARTKAAGRPKTTTRPNRPR